MPSCERTWTAILKFYNNCKNNIPGKKGYPKYSKRTRSVEFKKSGWKLNPDTKRITFTDGKNIGELKLIGSRDLFYFQQWQKRASPNSQKGRQLLCSVNVKARS